MLQKKKAKIIKDFQLSENDKGSMVVQIVLSKGVKLCKRKHMKVNKKDYSSNRDLLQMVEDRRKFLKVLKSKK